MEQGSVVPFLLLLLNVFFLRALVFYKKMFIIVLDDVPGTGKAINRLWIPGKEEPMTGIYDYIDVLAKGADASYLRNETLAQNIANVDTVNYSRQDVDFEGALQRALLKNSYISLDDKIKELDLSDLNVEAYTEHSQFSYRLDGNDVDIDTENVELAKNQLVYRGITSSITQELTRLQSVCK